MSTVNHIIAGKDSQVHTVAVTATAMEAIRVMNQHKIGSLVVTQDERVEGIFTERDVLRRVLSDSRPPTEITVAEVMTKDVICCSPETKIEEASRIMKDHRVRYLPVCNSQGCLLGLVSIGDLDAYHASDQEATIHFMHEYIHGRI